MADVAVDFPVGFAHRPDGQSATTTIARPLDGDSRRDVFALTEGTPFALSEDAPSVPAVVKATAKKAAATKGQCKKTAGKKATAKADAASKVATTKAAPKKVAPKKTTATKSAPKATTPKKTGSKSSGRNKAPKKRS
jgi:hypothetical protein